MIEIAAEYTLKRRVCGSSNEGNATGKPKPLNTEAQRHREEQE